MRELIITRIFNAPCKLVWKAWTEPEYVKNWWGPKDFTCPDAKIDFRVGGKYILCMRGPAGTDFEKDYWSTGEYIEIIPMKKIVVKDSFADEKGNVVPATNYGIQGFPLELQVAITFEEVEDDKTKMTLNYPTVGDIDETMFKNMNQGWNQSLDKFAEVLK